MGIKFEEVSHIYKGVNKHDLFTAIENINLNIEEKNEFVAIIGKTGSGKSTLIQHMNALLIPTSGNIYIFDSVVNKKNSKKLNRIRRRIGLVFQFPEYQLFEETVLKDVMFGPKNLGFTEAEAKEKAIRALKTVHLDEAVFLKSPFNLSGGQMRKVAIASILAMDTDVLILDEPTRGLDPLGQNEIMEVFYNIYKEYHKSIVIITHDMNIVNKYATRCVVLKDSKVVFDDIKDHLFISKDFADFSLEKPDILNCIDYLNEKLGINIPYLERIEDLLTYLKEGVYHE